MDSGALRLDFDRRLMLPFCVSVITSDGGRELDDVFALWRRHAPAKTEGTSFRVAAAVDIRAAGRLGGRGRRRAFVPRYGDALGGWRRGSNGPGLLRD
jgi:hypothetical protein